MPTIIVQTISPIISMQPTNGRSTQAPVTPAATNRTPTLIKPTQIAICVLMCFTRSSFRTDDTAEGKGDHRGGPRLPRRNYRTFSGQRMRVAALKHKNAAPWPKGRRVSSGEEASRRR
jgi:hypothetical protein